MKRNWSDNSGTQGPVPGGAEIYAFQLETEGVCVLLECRIHHRDMWVQVINKIKPAQNGSLIQARVTNGEESVCVSQMWRLKWLPRG